MLEDLEVCNHVEITIFWSWEPQKINLSESHAAWNLYFSRVIQITESTKDKYLYGESYDEIYIKKNPC